MRDSHVPALAHTCGEMEQLYTTFATNPATFDHSEGHGFGGQIEATTSLLVNEPQAYNRLPGNPKLAFCQGLSRSGAVSMLTQALALLSYWWHIQQLILSCRVCAMAQIALSPFHDDP